MIFKYFVIILAILLAASCAKTEKEEEEVAEIEAAYMGGRSAGRILVSRSWPDTT